jgi:REP element-mobilizing transposase RayT
MRERKLTRLAGYRYTTPGAYFITTVVHDRREILGKIVDGEIQLSRCGEIVSERWKWLGTRYSYVGLDTFVVMPNHFHGILNLNEVHVGNGRDHSLPDQVKSLWELVGAFKTTSSKQIHELGDRSFRWQSSFYDRIIRNDTELHRIRDYILSNPLRWELDVENPQCSRPGRAGRDRPLQRMASKDYYDEMIAPK